MRALGLDLGFANIGIAVITIADPPVVDVMRMFQTQKAKHRKASDDNLQRSMEISRLFFNLYEEFPDLKIIAAEAMSFPRNASIAGKMSMCWGVVAAFAERANLALLQTSPQEIKRLVTGSKSATKQEVQAGVKSLLPGQDLSSLHKKLAASKEEHIYDAVAAVLAAWTRPEFKLLNSLLPAGGSTWQPYRL